MDSQTARTPICSTELPAFAKLEPEFTKRGVKLLGLSVDPVEANSSWIDDMEDISGTRVKFPIISDSDRKVSTLYDMLDQQDATNVDTKGLPLTVRSVFIIDPSKKIRLILTYPASTGRNTAEVLRVVDSLQTGDKHTIATPINWVPGDDVVIPVSVSDEKAKTLFPKFRAIKPYLRLTPLGTESK
ncbi:Mitochondrial peroxiredoxin PRX1 [Candida viswanathii]|uniref:Mitochondrial peroxiredoxin PRX1 n=1 Tax=Candida viswanathii TaxID=5486 RepID=A0A367YJX5_9ASCO|nr:Mitochondrial peroxiredoxin PRX1 [Candida viswanathii]